MTQRTEHCMGLATAFGIWGFLPLYELFNDRFYQGIVFNDCFWIQTFDSEKADIHILRLTVKNRPKADILPFI